MPSEKTDMAVASDAGGNASPMSESAGGVSPASPTATPTRIANSAEYERTKPQAIVKALHAATLRLTTQRRLRVSANHPIGMAATA